MDCSELSKLLNFTADEKSLLMFLYDTLETVDIKTGAYIVGGFIRDKYLKLETRDIDVIIHQDVYDSLYCYLNDKADELCIKVTNQYILR